MNLKLSLGTFAILNGVRGDSHLRGRQLDGNNFGYNQTIEWYEDANKNSESLQPMCTGSVCGLWGDPHVVTCDNHRNNEFQHEYGCQAIGLVSLMKNPVYNIQGRFVPIGDEAIDNLRTNRKNNGETHWQIHNLGASVTGDIAIDIVPGNESKPVLQLGYGNLNEYLTSDGTEKFYPSENECNVRQYYSGRRARLNDEQTLAPKTGEPNLMQCRKKCEELEDCNSFIYWSNHICELKWRKGEEYLINADPEQGRVISGDLDSKCGQAPLHMPIADYDARMKHGVIGGWRGCPLLFHVDGELVDISGVNPIDGYLYGDESADISVQMFDHGQAVRILHKLDSGSTSEFLFESRGTGPGEIWPCSFNFNVCLPESDKDLFRDTTKGMLGTPNGDFSDDKKDKDGNIFVRYDLAQKIRAEYPDKPDNWIWDMTELEYCHDNWCVDHADAIMVPAPDQTMEDILCHDKEPLPEERPCIMTVGQIVEACGAFDSENFETCKLECCNGGCDDAIEHIERNSGNKNDVDVSLLTTEAPEEPACEEGLFQKTNTTACPASPLVKVRSGPSLPENQEIFYDINPYAGEDGNRAVSFRVNNPFGSAADIYVQYDHVSRINSDVLDPTCDGRLEVDPGCNAAAENKIEVPCISYPGHHAFALVEVYFVSQGSDFEGVDPEAEVNKCCVDRDRRGFYEELPFNVIKYVVQFQCHCPHDAQRIEIGN